MESFEDIESHFLTLDTKEIKEITQKINNIKNELWYKNIVDFINKQVSELYIKYPFDKNFLSHEHHINDQNEYQTELKEFLNTLDRNEIKKIARLKTDSKMSRENIIHRILLYLDFRSDTLYNKELFRIVDGEKCLYYVNTICKTYEFLKKYNNPTLLKIVDKYIEKIMETHAKDDINRKYKKQFSDEIDAIEKKLENIKNNEYVKELKKLNEEVNDILNFKEIVLPNTFDIRYN